MSALPGTLNAPALLAVGTVHGLASVGGDALQAVLQAAEALVGGRGPYDGPGLAGPGPDALERLANGGLAYGLVNDGPGGEPPFVAAGHAAGEPSSHGGPGSEAALVRHAVDGGVLPRLVDTRQVAGAVAALAQQAPSTVTGVVGTLQRELPPTDFRHFVQDAAGAVRGQVTSASEALAAVRMEAANLGQRADTLAAAITLVTRDVASTPWTHALVPGVPALAAAVRDAGGWLPTVAVPHLAVAGKAERVQGWIGVLELATAQLRSAPTLRPLLAPLLQQLLTVLRGLAAGSLPAPLQIAMVRLAAETEAALGFGRSPAPPESARPPAGAAPAPTDLVHVEQPPALLAAAAQNLGGVQVLTDGAPAYMQLSGIEAAPFGGPAGWDGPPPGPQPPVIDIQGFPVFNPLAEVYLEHSHVESASTDQRFAAANAELGQALRDSPSLQDHLGLSDLQTAFLQRQPEPWSEAARIAPPDLVWHHH